jgi:ferredoxin
VSSLNIQIDEDRCQGHAMCYLLAPGLFGVDDHGRGTVEHEVVPDHEVALARVAVDRCPEQAITTTAA